MALCLCLFIDCTLPSVGANSTAIWTWGFYGTLTPAKHKQIPMPLMVLSHVKPCRSRKGFESWSSPRQAQERSTPAVEWQTCAGRPVGGIPPSSPRGPAEGHYQWSLAPRRETTTSVNAKQNCRFAYTIKEELQASISRLHETAFQHTKTTLCEKMFYQILIPR